MAHHRQPSVEAVQKGIMKKYMYVTKNCLTKGIRYVECEQHCPEMLWHGDEWFYAKDAHETWEAAVVRAEDIRAKKLRSLEKQRKAIEAIEWQRPEGV